jgi:hypothetical protein
MARSPGTNPLTQALDARIRTVVEEVVSRSFEKTVRDVVREELARSLATGGRGRPGRPAAKAAAPTRRNDDKRCNVAGCPNDYRSQGYCAAHYQAARKYGWPMPAPKNYNPPPRPARGRPPKDKARESKAS